jgi:hypothetical protein
MLHRRGTTLVGMTLLVAAVMLILSSSALAYKAQSKWQGVPYVYYYLDPNNDAYMNVAGTVNNINQAAAQWNQASAFRLYPGSGYNSSLDTISTANFVLSPPCGVNDTTSAVTCLNASPTAITRIHQYFNTSSTYAWNTTNTHDNSTTPKKRDVWSVAAHEFGHWHSLGDGVPGHPESIMNAVKRTLSEDDKQGATQIYGPLTGWESAEAIGEYNRIAYIQNVVGFYNNSSPPPELGRVSSELSVPVPSGSKYERMAGYARNSYSYAYFTLFTAENDSDTYHNYLQIRNGMKLKWLQYNYYQSNMSVDFEMTDGSVLRGSGLTDQNGLTVHPAGRTAVPIGQWLYFEVNLSPLAGKQIRRWFIAYDNGNNGRTGVFRAYFDDLKVVY